MKRRTRSLRERGCGASDWGMCCPNGGSLGGFGFARGRQKRTTCQAKRRHCSPCGGECDFSSATIEGRAWDNCRLGRVSSKKKKSRLDVEKTQSLVSCKTTYENAESRTSPARLLSEGETGSGVVCMEKPSTHRRVKLPKMDLPKSDGTVTKWTPFGDSFDDDEELSLTSSTSWQVQLRFVLVFVKWGRESCGLALCGSCELHCSNRIPDRALWKQTADLQSVDGWFVKLFAAVF